MQNDYLLEVKNLTTRFHTQRGVAHAVNGVSFGMYPGEILGVVGESGCGKSVTAQSIMRLIPEPPGRIESGEILYDGKDIVSLSTRQMRKIRGDRISMIFQEPMTSLNPVKTVGRQIGEVYALHRGVSKKESMQKAVEMLEKVQVPEPARRVKEYPHQLSGGMRQRVMIAMALACDPEILIADEPTTALDVTVQAQIMDLMLKLQAKQKTSIMMITHDLGIIAEMANRVIVMYAGRIVESAPTRTLFRETGHPYTKGLMNSVPVIGSKDADGNSRLTEITGMVPSLYDLPQGCSFAPRCPHRNERCQNELPPLFQVSPGHEVRCWMCESSSVKGAAA
ncbi:ABC transporter ATP-binding protein [Desulfoluna spongiiphila]|uniref:ABC transporter ATP-binding protein n=1 Tax=Desulfoluna spongiiphila TaxID=419481 RepID=UPI001257914A|nr:ABC transporter ATP-binding protein [Desulfoluna spongiiphila]VVS95598.1 abc transporter-like [Desulfoluna spongiiphila]